MSRSMRLGAGAAFASLLVALSAAGTAPARAELLVNVSKQQQRVSVSIDGLEAFRWPVSTGRRGYDTPAGKFRPTRLERRWYSRQYENSPMPWAVFFHRGYALHGTTEAYNLGRAASHGCVRLRPDNASVLYSLIRRYGANNTRVVVMNGPLPAVTPIPLPPLRAPESPAPAITMADINSVLARATPDEAAPSAPAATLSAKRHDAARETPRAEPAPRLRTAAFAGSDEARVLREREAWLRGLDRKYGITR